MTNKVGDAKIPQIKPSKLNAPSISFSGWVDVAAGIWFVISSLWLLEQWYFGHIVASLAALAMPSVYGYLILFAVVSIVLTALAHHFTAKPNADKSDVVDAKKRYNALFLKRHYAPIKNYWGYVVTAFLVAGILGGGLVGLCTGSQPLVFVSAYMSRTATYLFLIFMSLVWSTIYGKEVLAMVRKWFTDEETLDIMAIHNKAVDKYKTPNEEVKSTISAQDIKTELNNWIRAVNKAWNEKKKQSSSLQNWEDFLAKYQHFTGIAFDDKSIKSQCDSKSGGEQSSDNSTASTKPTSHKGFPWAKWLVWTIGFVNGFVNGTGTLFAAIGVCDFIFGHAAVLMWPLYVKYLVLSLGFMSGACAAWGLTWIGIETFANTILGELGYIKKPKESKEEGHGNQAKQKPGQNNRIWIGALIVVTLMGLTACYAYGLLSSLMYCFDVVAALVASAALYVLYPSMPSRYEADDLMRKYNVAIGFAILTAIGMACFQFNTGFTMLPNIFEWLGIVTTGNWLAVLSTVIGWVCLILTLFAASGFFTNFCMQKLENFDRGGREQGWLAWGFSKVLVLVPTTATVIMIWKTTFAFPKFASFPYFAAFFMSICGVYLLGKLFMDNAATWYDIATLWVTGDGNGTASAQLFTLQKGVLTEFEQPKSVGDIAELNASSSSPAI